MRSTVNGALVLCAAAALLWPCAAGARTMHEAAPVDDLSGLRPTMTLWEDDMESGPGEWLAVDETAGVTPQFHVDTYLAGQGTYSWWCGTFDYDANGGYGNAWDQHLELPPIDISGAANPVLSYMYRHDCENVYDFTNVEVMDGGAWIVLNPSPYTGSSGGWQDLGQYGFVVSGYDEPLRLRFRFTSDGAWSDEDGSYDSVGGAFHADSIRVYDSIRGERLFFDDVEDGTGLCTPAVPDPAGQYWHIIDRRCPALSDAHSWWCGDDADTSQIPANIDCSLITPAIDVSALSPTATCTIRYAAHFECPPYQGDALYEYVSLDDGVTWYFLYGSWGDFGQCSGWAGPPGPAYGDLTPYLQYGGTMRYRFRFETDDDGCGPGTAGGAGVMLDDVSVSSSDTPVESMHWGRIKALYR